MKNEEKLLLAIGEISDDIILEASTPYKRKFIPTKKTMAIAASIAVVTIGITMLPRLFDGVFDKNAGGSAAPEYGDGMNGMQGDLDIREADFGYLVYTGKVAENTYSFKLVIITKPDEPIDVRLYSKDKSIVYTTADNAEDGITVRRPTITVNGERSDKIPTDVGDYEIEISFDNLEKDIKWDTTFDMGVFHLFHRHSFD